MTIQLGDTGRVSVGPLKKFTITLATPNETLLGSPTSITATTNPGSAGAQISYTIQSSDLPTISPAAFSVQYGLTFVTGGKNTDAASQTLNYTVYKNGTQSSTGNTAIATNTFWTLNSYVYPVQVGDVITVALWASVSTINFDYYTPMIVPTRPQLTVNPTACIKDLTIGTSGSVIQTLTKGNPQVWLNSGSLFYHGTRGDGVNSGNNIGINVNSGFKAAFSSLNPTYNAYVVSYGDTAQNGNSTAALTNATYRPRYAQNSVPSTITFREIAL